MDEKEYKDTYNRINQLKCVFEKAMCSLKCNCSQGRMFRLADRHGFACHSPLDQKRCTEFLEHLRNQTRFVFKINDIDGPLPHNKEIRVQNGGLLGLQKLLIEDDPGNVADVSDVIKQAINHYEDMSKIPFDKVMQSVTAYQARPKRKSKKT